MLFNRHKNVKKHIDMKSLILVASKGTRPYSASLSTSKILLPSLFTCDPDLRWNKDQKRNHHHRCSLWPSWQLCPLACPKGTDGKRYPRPSGHRPVQRGHDLPWDYRDHQGDVWRRYFPTLVNHMTASSRMSVSGRTDLLMGVVPSYSWTVLLWRSVIWSADNQQVHSYRSRHQPAGQERTAWSMDDREKCGAGTRSGLRPCSAMREKYGGALIRSTLLNQSTASSARRRPGTGCSLMMRFAMKVVRLAIMDAFRKWTMPIRNRKSALNRFCIEFGERISACLW